MSNEAALQVLEPRLDEMERKANALLAIVNDLRAEDGLPPRPPYGGGPSKASSRGGDATGAAVAQIRPDTFYGKKLQTAVREYLEMRGKPVGPAKPREIYQAITAGGFQFETNDETVALVGLRAMLRKRTNFFHKLPNGTYGLTVWYPDARKTKGTAPASEAAGRVLADHPIDDDDAESEAADAGKTSAA
jgi:hypothetical protein